MWRVVRALLHRRGKTGAGELGWQAWNSHFRLVPEVGRIASLRQFGIDIPGSLPACPLTEVCITEIITCALVDVCT